MGDKNLPDMATLREAYGVYGVAPKNPRWSWSARSDDGGVVVLALWTDRMDWKSRPRVYDDFGRHDLADRDSQPGNVERIENLRHARDHCEGLFRVVLVEPVDRDSRPRRIKDRWAKPELLMRLVRLDEETGEFRAEESIEASAEA